MNLKWDDLRTFLAVAREGSLTAAAERLGSSQPTVSRRIRALEQALGAAPLRRVDERYLLTAFGENVYQRAAEMEQSVYAIERQSSTTEQQIAGRVRIATTECIASAWLMGQVQALTELHPALEIEVLTDVRYADLTRKEADLAIRIGVSGAEGLRCERLGSVRFDLYANERYLAQHGRPESLAALTHHTGIESLREISGVPQAVAFRQAMSGDCPLGLNSILSQLQAVQCGLGIMVLPKHLCVADRSLQRLLPQHFRSQRDLWLITHPDSLSSPRFRVTWEHLDRALRNDALLFTD